MLPKATIMRAIAVLLSLSFIWLIVACESLCSIHCLRANERDTRVSCCVPDDAHEADCCPVTNPPNAVLSDRSMFAQPQSSDQQSTVIISEHLLNQLCLRPAFRFIQYSASDPPFDRLLALRV
jgi:hypothetical protein